MDEYVSLVQAASELAKYIEAERTAAWQAHHPELSYRVARIIGDMAQVEKLNAIRLIRALTDLGLHDSKVLVDEAMKLGVTTAYNDAVEQLRAALNVVSVESTAGSLMRDMEHNPELSMREISLINGGIRRLANKLGASL